MMYIHAFVTSSGMNWCMSTPRPLRRGGVLRDHPQPPSRIEIDTSA